MLTEFEAGRRARRVELPPSRALDDFGRRQGELTVDPLLRPVAQRSPFGFVVGLDLLRLAHPHL